MAIHPANIELLYKLKDKLVPRTDEWKFFEYCMDNRQFTVSQNFQDLWVAYEVQDKDDGYFVEFGAHDGFDGSNTLFLQNTLEWRGLLAEPNPLALESLKKRVYDDVQICTRAVLDESDQLVVFSIAKDDQQLSTVAGFEDGDYNFNARKNIELVEATTITLNDMLETFLAPKDIDYISVDTEGTELIILEKFFKENTKYKVKMFTIEHNYKESREKIARLMADNGYVNKFPEFSRWDEFYILKDGT